jgi:hypothetical protein
LSFCHETSVFALGHSSPATSADTLDDVQLDALVQLLLRQQLQSIQCVRRE